MPKVDLLEVYLFHIWPETPLSDNIMKIFSTINVKRKVHFEPLLEGFKLQRHPTFTGSFFYDFFIFMNAAPEVFSHR